jgi:pimeloyl-ACP methyl ester carboxylesterase
MPRFLLRQSYYEYFATNHEEQKELLVTLQKENERYTDTTFLDGIRTMVLWGEKDELFSLKEGEKFAKAVSAEFYVIPKAGHAPQADRPKKFTRSICEFIRN